MPSATSSVGSCGPMTRPATTVRTIREGPHAFAPEPGEGTWSLRSATPTRRALRSAPHFEGNSRFLTCRKGPGPRGVGRRRTELLTPAISASYRARTCSRHRQNAGRNEAVVSWWTFTRRARRSGFPLSPSVVRHAQAGFGLAWGNHAQSGAWPASFCGRKRSCLQNLLQTSLH